MAGIGKGIGTGKKYPEIIEIGHPIRDLF